MRELTPVTLAWAAGMFEGEGTIAISKSTRRNLGHLNASMVNTDYEVIAFFRYWWDGYYRHQPMPENRRDAHRWSVAARQAGAFLEVILPYLRTARVSDKAVLGLEYQAQKSLIHVVNRAADYRERQDRYYVRMKELNRRGADPEMSKAAVDG